MQDITPKLKQGAKQIDAYGAGGFRVAGERVEGNILITPGEVHKFIPSAIENTQEQYLSEIISSANDIEVLLVGCGEGAEFFSHEIEKKLKTLGINVEYMSTGAACRTYNILLLEERKVAAVLIAV